MLSHGTDFLESSFTLCMNMGDQYILAMQCTSKVVCAHADDTNPSASAKWPPRYGGLNTPEGKAITACLESGEQRELTDHICNYAELWVLTFKPAAGLVISVDPEHGGSRCHGESG